MSDCAPSPQKKQNKQKGLPGDTYIVAVGINHKEFSSISSSGFESQAYLHQHQLRVVLR